MEVIKRLAWPSLLIVALLLALRFALEDHAPQDEARLWLLQGLEVALWLSVTWLLGRLLGVLLWEGAVRRAIQRDPPRLVVQLSHAGLYLAAGAGILAFVFDQSVTALWAPSASSSASRSRV